MNKMLASGQSKYLSLGRHKINEKIFLLAKKEEESDEQQSETSPQFRNNRSKLVDTAKIIENLPDVDCELDLIEMAENMKNRLKHQRQMASQIGHQNETQHVNAPSAEYQD